MNCCFWMMNNNKNKIIDINKTQYYGKVDTVFTLRNDFFMCPPFHSYKILDDYDKHNIVIKETKYFFGEETHDGAGYEQYHNRKPYRRITEYSYNRILKQQSISRGSQTTSSRSNHSRYGHNVWCMVNQMANHRFRSHDTHVQLYTLLGRRRRYPHGYS